MRKEAKLNNNVNLANIQGYHNGTWDESYINLGFSEGLFFLNSDRKVKTLENYVRTDGKQLECYAVEVEVESKMPTSDSLAEVLDKIIFPYFPSGLWKMQRDGSLGGSSYKTSAECICQPMTKLAVRNQYKNFKTMFNTYFPRFSISATATGNCGMHVNISNGCFGKTKEAQDEAIRKLYYFINKYFKLCCELFKRDYSRTHYCGRMDYTIAKTMDLADFYTDHGCCFNLGHYKTGRIELRLVGGQKDYYSFRNTMETVFFLVERMQKISWADLENGDFKKIFKNCNQYVCKRLQDCIGYDGLTPVDCNEIWNTRKEEELL